MIDLATKRKVMFRLANRERGWSSNAVEVECVLDVKCGDMRVRPLTPFKFEISDVPGPITAVVEGFLDDFGWVEIHGWETDRHIFREGETFTINPVE